MRPVSVSDDESDTTYRAAFSSRGLILEYEDITCKKCMTSTYYGYLCNLSHNNNNVANFRLRHRTTATDISKRGRANTDQTWRRWSSYFGCHGLGFSSKTPSYIGQRPVAKFLQNHVDGGFITDRWTRIKRFTGYHGGGREWEWGGGPQWYIDWLCYRTYADKINRVYGQRYINSTVD